MLGVLQAFGTLWEPAFQRLLKPMVLTGLSAPLTKALQRIARKLPPTLPAIQQHLLLPVLAALPIAVEQPDLSSMSNGASAASLPLSNPMGQSVAKHRDLGAYGRGQVLARMCFQVRSALLKPGLTEFAKQVQAQVRPTLPARACSRLARTSRLVHLTLAPASCTIPSRIVCAAAH